MIFFFILLIPLVIFLDYKLKIFGLKVKLATAKYEYIFLAVFVAFIFFLVLLGVLF